MRADQAALRHPAPGTTCDSTARAPRRSRRSLPDQRRSRGSLRGLLHDAAGAAATVNLLAESLRQQQDLDDAALQRIDNISRQARWIAELSDSALDGARAPGEVRLDQVVGDAVDSARLVHGTRLAASLAPAAVTGTPLALWRLASNLVENACRAAGPDGRVDVRVAGDDGVATLTVADSGPGLPLEQLHAMAADPAVPGAGHRRGVGLRVVTDIVEECEGRLRTAPPELGGTTLVVELPLGRRPDPATPFCADQTGALR